MVTRLTLTRCERAHEECFVKLLCKEPRYHSRDIVLAQLQKSRDDLVKRCPSLCSANLSDDLRASLKQPQQQQEQPARHKDKRGS